MGSRALTHHHLGWSVNVATSKIRHKHDHKLKLMLTSEKSLVRPQGMEDKALKVVDSNRRLVSPNVGEIHERVCREIPMPQSLVDKIVAFHCGQLTLTVENLIQLNLFLETRFRRFAENIPEFMTLGEDDRNTLLLANSPYYFQLYMARYINSKDGLSQVQALLGRDIPTDLANCDKFLSITFRYFASALVLFSDKTAMEVYEDKANLISKVALLDDERKLGHFVACIVFQNDSTRCRNDFDAPGAIARAFDCAVKSAALQFEAKPYWSSPTNLISTIAKLKGMVHYYSFQANIRGSDTSYGHLDTDQGLGDEFLFESFSDPISLTTMPHPATAKEEEEFWMDRQLAKCEEKNRTLINLGEDFLHEAAMLFLLHDDAPLSNKFFVATFKTFVERNQLMLELHHEYRDLVSYDHPAVASFRQGLNSNVVSAAAFAFSVVFDEMSSAKVYEGLVRVMGNNDQQLWNDQFHMLVPNDAIQHMICVDRHQNLSFLGLPEGMLQSHLTMVTNLREALGTFPPDLLLLIQLAILWRVPDDFRDSSNPLIMQAQVLFDRYIYRLNEKLSASVTQQLFDTLL